MLTVYCISNYSNTFIYVYSLHLYMFTLDNYQSQTNFKSYLMVVIFNQIIK